MLLLGIIFCQASVQHGRRRYIMKIYVAVLTFLLADAVTMQRLWSDVEETKGRALSDVLEATSQPSCSLILLTDGSILPSTIIKMVSHERASPRGISVFNLKADSLDANETLAESSPLLEKVRQVRLASWCVTMVLVSQHQYFLAAFAESSLKGRLLVWATRLLVVTRLTLPQLYTLIPAHWTFSMMNTIFLNLRDTTPTLRYSLYTYLPYSPDGAQLVRVATWTPKRGIILLTELSFFTEKFLDFYEEKVNVTALPWPPYWDEEVEEAPDGTSVRKYSGSDYLALKATSEALNFVINVLPSKSWDEVEGKMMQRVSFMVPIYYIIFPERVKLFDFTHIYEFSQATFSMAKPSLKPSWQSLYYPLTNDVWAAVLTVLLLMPAIFYMINTKGKGGGADGKLSVGAVVLEVTGILVGQNLPLRLPDINSNRLLLTLWLVFSFVIGTAYRSNLIAALTLPKYPSRPETVEEMVDVVDRATMPPFGEAWRTFFAASESKVYQRLAKLMELGPGATEGLQMATEQNVASLNGRRYMANIIAENFTQVDGTTPLYLAQESIFPGPSGWAIPHDAPYKAQVDRCLMAIIEAGLYEKWSEEFLRETRRKSLQRQQEHLAHQEQQSGGSSSITALTLTHMQGPLMLLFITLVLAGMTFTGEILVQRFTGELARPVAY